MKKVWRSGGMSTLQRQQMNAMWAALVEDVKRQIEEARVKLRAEAKDGEKVAESKVDMNTSRMLPMADVSGSMSCSQCIPMFNSIGLSLVLCEVAHPAFRNRVLTFESKPQWVVFQETEDFVDRVQKLRNAPWGGSTNFLKAMRMIASVARDHGLAEKDVPGLVCFSDMKFDAAQGYGQSWDTHYERIVKKWASLGCEVCGTAYAPPRMCFWDLHGAGQQPGFPVTQSTRGVHLLSGFSPALLKLVLTGVTGETETPWKTFLKAVLDKRYDLARTTVSSAGKCESKVGECESREGSMSRMTDVCVCVCVMVK